VSPEPITPLYILRMIRILFLAVGIGAALSPASGKPIILRYTFTPDFGTASPSLHVMLTFQGSDAGTSKLILPTTWAGQRDLFNAIHNLRSEDSSTVIRPSDSDGTRTLQYPPGSTIRISYDLTNDWTEPLRHPKEFRVVVLNTHAILNGQNGLIYPDIGQMDLVEATFHWRKLPRSWIVASSFGTGRNGQHFHGEWRVVYNAIFAAGDFRVTRLESGGETLTLAARGSWVFSDQQAADEIQSIFGVERKFWGETKPNRFLVVLTPYDQDSGSSDGTVFSDAFLLYLSRKQTFLTDEKSLLAHEVFHTWNPYRMGQPAGEATEWFTEGFTRYYQDRILLEAGLVTYPEYIARLNQILTAYWSSPDRNWSQQKWLERKNTGKPESTLPYERGAMIALWLDQRIRKNSSNQRSLDNRMFALLKSPEKQLSTDFLITALTNDLPPEDIASLRSYVEDGVTISLPAELEPDCGTLVLENVGKPQYKPTDQLGCRDQLKSQRSK
jgi:predicted metalloprotease with PDZ domain